MRVSFSEMPLSADRVRAIALVFWLHVCLAEVLFPALRLLCDALQINVYDVPASLAKTNWLLELLGLLASPVSHVDHRSL